MNAVATLPERKQKLRGPQLRFSMLIGALEELTTRKLQFEAMVQKHRADHLQTVDAHEKALDMIQHDMLVLMHTRLQSPGLPARQRMFLQDYIASAIESLADQFADLKALLPLYVDDEEAAALDSEAMARAQSLRRECETALGLPIEGADSATTAQALLNCIYSAMRADAQQAQQAKAEKRAAKQHKKQATKATARATQAAGAAALPIDPKTALRAIFRQLASALHPDREPDPAERARKTELMSQANAAHERGDLVSLLKLQLQADRIDPQHLANMADDRVAAMCALVQKQIEAAKAELDVAQMRACSEFGLLIHAGMTDAELTTVLAQVHEGLAYTQNGMQLQLDDARTDEGLKRWIKGYKQSLR